MSPRKLTEDDKQEILQLYRNSEATTSTLANRYEVSSSTISRFLKNKLSSTEYEDLIQQKRLARTPRGETTAKAKKETKQKKEATATKKKVKQKKETVPKEKKTRKRSSSKTKSDSIKIADTADSLTEIQSTEAEPVEIKPAEIKPAEIIEPAMPLTSEAIAKVRPAHAEETSAGFLAQAKPESKPLPKRRRRRRSSVSEEAELADTVNIAEENVAEPTEEIADKPTKLIIDKKVTPNSVEDESDKPSKSSSLILKNDATPSDSKELPSQIEDGVLEDTPADKVPSPLVAANRNVLRPTLGQAPVKAHQDSDRFEEIDSSGFGDEDDEDENEVNLITLKEMLGEDLEDINDEDDDEGDDDWEEENEPASTYSKQDSSLSNLEILPLSQASFSGTCYLVIDRSAELIVKPLAEFADLGEIPDDEVRQRTLPVFDNHRIAKRFSHRRERVIKVPDGRILQKTSRHLQEKGITRLLMDGQIYSLWN